MRQSQFHKTGTNYLRLARVFVDTILINVDSLLSRLVVIHALPLFQISITAASYSSHEMFLVNSKEPHNLISNEGGRILKKKKKGESKKLEGKECISNTGRH